MNHPATPSRRGVRRATARLTTLALAAAGLAAVSLGTAPPASAAPVAVTGATFSWGISGYAQKGIFGPWNLKGPTGGASVLKGSVSGGLQAEYAAAPVPTTSMPVSSPQKSPNAVRFSGGTGSADVATGAATLTWTGAYTVNAYPASYNAPDETYSNPELTIADDGSGSMTMNVALGAGQDINGTPTPPQNLGRLTVMSFTAAADVRLGNDSFRLSPAYQGVEVNPPTGTAQARNCPTTGGATGWWGSWPTAYVLAMPDSVRPHFYSTACGGLQDNKPPLPLDVDFGVNANPAVSVSDTSLLPSGQQSVTVTGTAFDPTLAIGNRPPFAGKQSGVYIAFGRYQDHWRPTFGAASSTRTNQGGGALKWAVPAASFPGSGQDPSSAAYTELTPAGTFSTTLQVDPASLAGATGNYGIYTYAGGGANVAAYETFTPVTFAKVGSSTKVKVTKKPKSDKKGKAQITVTGSGGAPGDGKVKVKVTTKTGKKVDKLGKLTLVNGTVKVKLPKLDPGKYKLVVSYLGSVNFEVSDKSRGFKVVE